ncbi:type 1 glutamine amidotransferase [Geomesophilobacter sediminis]|uniref:Type 1 glutamine amidotransferase n=1 Tax=Geomesophilobacter sediminis TaxID=2798584 RepID=A0A8J7JLN7_9BACT|nr:type 1 glutamine amidotransferase [Geomesophilobacter sediminis]MBJ6725105.1 type 1 glutamine amidotransferase [Geomesophilobacter sediminis]
MFLIVQNDPHCPAGSCAPIIEARAASFRVVAGYDDLAFPDPTRFQGVIVLGGEMSVYATERFPYLDRVRSLMRECVDRQVPLFGICLGGQLLAQVLGGTVSSPSSHGEKGIHSVTLTEAGAGDPLFAGLAETFTTFQMHNDSFTLPPSATLLAHSAACPVQAFRYGATAYAVQFHPEVDRDIVSCWSEFPPPEPDLVRQYEVGRAAYDADSRRIIGNFVSLALRRYLS